MSPLKSTLLWLMQLARLREELRLANVTTPKIPFPDPASSAAASIACDAEPAPAVSHLAALEIALYLAEPAAAFPSAKR